MTTPVSPASRIALSRCAGGLFLAVVAVALHLSCSSDSTGLAPCSDDAECTQGWCDDGTCAPGDRPEHESRSEDGLDQVSGNSNTSSTSGTATSRPGSRGDYLDPCVRNEDCRSGICISSPLGRVCTKPCSLDDECAPAAGWRCQLIQGDRDLVRVCYPDATDLCEACTVDTECGGLNDLCIELENGTYCGLDCRHGGVCPDGFFCVDDPDKEWAQCLPVENRCGDCRDADLQNDPFNCGECDHECAFDFGAASCVNGSCVLVDCDPGRGNCDGDDDTGCEVDILEDVLHCGACDAPCPTDAGPVRCVEGDCVFDGCPSDQILCTGGCRTPNACSGCDSLPATPGVSTCGACDTGTWHCDPEDANDLVCTGATDPLTDSQNCGETCTACEGGQTCQDGACTCNSGDILCAGVCQAPNACGGCDALPAAPDADPCGACDTGTWQCDPANPNALQCIGETNPLTDSQNCGETCTACEGGQACQNGSCTCNSGDLLCEGVCQAPNACGGCGTLPATPDLDPCGACDTGTWQCDPANPNALQCIGETNPLTDNQNCGDACDTCQGGQTCQNGTCACTGGEILCAGACQAPNACGGCDALPATPDLDPCGACDTGTWQCNPGNPNALQCVGETNPLTDSQNCGDACDTCQGGQTCQNGACSCSGGQVLCGGTCVTLGGSCGQCGNGSQACVEGAVQCVGDATDACGECELGRNLGDTCQTCGSWACNPGGTGWTCSNFPDFTSDPLNCGGCGTLCQGGRICQAGECTCPGGQILCNGACQAPNACGGCAPLSATPGQESCGLCNNGVLECDPANPNELTCVGATTDVCTGGCDELDRELLDTCEDCGVWVCGGQTWQCLRPDFNVNDQHCGGCFNACATNESCESAVCVPGPRPISNVWMRNIGIWYSELQSYMTGTKGYSVSRTNTLNASVLANHDLIFVDMFAARDATVSLQDIEDWVRDGGALVILGYTGRLTVGDGEPSDDPQRCALLNPLMSRFGMRFSNVTNNTSSCTGGNFNNANVFPTTIGNHPIVRNPDLTSSNLTPRSGWRIQTLNATSESIAWIRTTDAVVQVAEVGSGRVVALADGRPAYGMVLGNRVFWDQTFDWLRFAQ